VTTILWTDQARSDLAAIHAFISQDSPHYAALAVSRLIAAVDRLVQFPESGHAVPEFDDRRLREVVQSPYRIVYRFVSRDEVHVLTVHHSSKKFPTEV
jgi:toxin ParE1/3/4